MVIFNKLSQLQSLYREKARIVLNRFKNEMFKKHILFLKNVYKKLVFLEKKLNFLVFIMRDDSNVINKIHGGFQLVGQK